MSELKYLPFFKFFRQLRDNVGIELDNQQYAHFLHCFLIKKPSNEEELYNLCKTLWLPRDSYRIAFENLFKEAILDVYKDFEKVSSMRVVEENPDVENPDEEKPDEENPDEEKPVEENPDEEKPDEEKPDEEKPVKEKPDVGKPVEENPDVEKLNKNEEKWVDVILNIHESKEKNGKPIPAPDPASLLENPFLFSNTKHYPFNFRKTQQLWRRYKCKSSLELTDELDLIKTIQDYSKNKVLNHFRFKYKRQSIQKLIWLSDHAGDMTPFEEWDNALLEIVKGSFVFGNLERFYFHRYPIVKELNGSHEIDFYVFKDKAQTIIQSLNEIFQNWNKDVLIIIFSDGGAARHHNDSERLSVFYEFYEKFKGKAKIRWLNPVSKRVGSSAGIISLLLPMYTINDESLQQLVRDL